MKKNTIEENFKERAKVLKKWQRILTGKMQNRPEGRLRITHKRGRPMFYWERGDGKSKYIRKGDIELAKQLAQKDYEEKTLQAVKQELQAIDNYSKIAPKRPAEDIYGRMNEERRELIRPIDLSEKERIRRWMSKTYEGKPFREGAPSYYTDRGERVRSKSELIIANLLHRLGIAYKYEAPLLLEGYGVLYPDFTILHPTALEEIYLEHFGMMDDPGYAEKALRKVHLYERNGIFPGKKLILTHETSSEPLDSKLLMEILEAYLLDPEV